jgi:hypothetical protein
MLYFLLSLISLFFICLIFFNCLDRPLDNVEEMKISVRSNHNRAEEVKARAKE